MRSTMTLRNKIILQCREEAYGHRTKPNITAEKEVYGCIQMPSLSFQAANETAGRKIDLSVHVWRSEFESGHFTHAVISGTAYRINGTGASVNDLYIRLSLERGVAG